MQQLLAPSVYLINSSRPFHSIDIVKHLHDRYTLIELKVFEYH